MTKSLNDLNASDLARIDAICLDFETRLRAGNAPSIDDIVAERGGEHENILRQELLAVAKEIEAPSTTSDSARPAVPFAFSESAGSSSTENRTPDNTRASVESATEQHEPRDSGTGDLPRPGESIGPYRIESELGRGGMGVVMRATDTRLDRAVAIKILAIQGDHHHEQLAERFQREAKAVARITHPNVVELFDIGSFNGLPYVVMELLQGDLLLDYQRQRKMTPSEVRSIGAQLADALATSHSFGVIHRDLKPQNVMLSTRSSSDGNDVTLMMPASDELAAAITNNAPGATPKPTDGIQVKLFDFGLSRSPLRGSEMAAPADAGESSDIDAETRVGMIMGTPGYMAPEQARGESVSPAADIFSLGCVLHEAFYGQRAFDGSTPADRFAATLRETPLVDPIRRREDVELAEIIESCLAKDIDARPSSAAQLAKRLGAEAVRPLAAASSHPTSPSQDNAPTMGPADGGFSRRRFAEGIAGGMLGLSYAGWMSMSQSNAMRTIESIGVLSLVDANANTPSDSSPIGPRISTPGEQLSVSLVNALSRADGLTVPRFFPLVASEPAEYIAAAETLQVDALVDGDFRRSGDDSLEVDLRIVSGTNGKLLWADTVKVPAGDSLVERKVLAERLASEVGRVIRDYDEGASPQTPKDPEVFSCINKGVAALDPDRKEALRSSLKCFRHAAGLDKGFDEAQGGLATAALILAYRSDKSSDPSSQTLLKYASDALAAVGDSQHPAVRLARAIYEWQIERSYESARLTLVDLGQQHRNEWLAHHQLGMLSLTLGDDDTAIDHLERASLLARTVQSVQADLVRAFWFQEGGRQAAITRAKVLLNANPDDIHARGLLIDLYEDQEDYQAAADLDNQFGELTGVSPTTVSREAYFERRGGRLTDIPYGSFDRQSNRIIHLMRRNVAVAGFEEIFLAWQSEVPPSMPYLLARHPALRPLRSTEAATRILPAPSTISTGPLG